jgi:hypothetical protein
MLFHYLSLHDSVVSQSFVQSENSCIKGKLAERCPYKSEADNIERLRVLPPVVAVEGEVRVPGMGSETGSADALDGWQLKLPLTSLSKLILPVQ